MVTDNRQEASSPAVEQEQHQKHHTEHHSSHPSSEHHHSTVKDDEVIDFSKLKKSFTHFFKQLTQKVSEKDTKDTLREAVKEESSSDLSLMTALAAVKKNARWIIPLLCILIALSLSIYLRTMPQRLPVTEQWAQQPVYNFYRDQIVDAVDKQNPHLPPDIKKSMVDKEWEKIKKENAQLLESQINDLSQQYQDMFRDDAGTLYLLGIDPYYYYRQSYYVLQNGFPGSEMKDGKLWDSYRLAPVGREAEWNFHNWFGALWHRMMNLFGNYSLMYTFFFVGTVFSALTVIPGFFIGRRLTKNNVGGFFVAILLASSAFFVSRTTGESSDTDVYAVFFPVLITWLFVEALEAKTMKKKMLWMALAAFSTGVFSFAWTGWWYIAVFIIATQLVHLLALIFLHRKTIMQSWKGLLSRPLSVLGLYVGLSALSVSIFTAPYQALRFLLGPQQFIKLKAVAVKTAWPNIRTTVAELNVVSFDNVIAQLGGKFLFFLALLGILFLLLRKNEEGKRDIRYTFFLAVWLIASLYATTKGVRFILQATPVFSIALGVCLGMVWDYGSRWTTRHLKVPKTIAAVIFFAALLLLLRQPIEDGYHQAYNSVPSMNDAWYDTLTKIKTEAPQNIIITSWWDFGHWFKAIADRPVTFDGGTQVGHGAHWVGKSLLTDDEAVTVGILRMLNCGQNTAFEELNAILNDTLNSIDTINAIIVQSKEDAAATLKSKGLTGEQAASILQFTHCLAPPDYFITSEDMIGKSGVWGHFGSWDFRKAVYYQKTKKLSREEAVQYFTLNFNMSKEEANRLHAEIQAEENADSWIAPWPGYASMFRNCDNLPDNKVRCATSIRSGETLSFIVDTQSYDVQAENAPDLVPNSIVYTTKEGVEEKTLSGKKIGLSLVLTNNENRYQFMLADPLHASSTFTKLFFLDGQGMDCFRKFDDVSSPVTGRVITWILDDYDCLLK